MSDFTCPSEIRCFYHIEDKNEHVAKTDDYSKNGHKHHIKT